MHRALKSIENALEIRRHILTAFEETESATDERTRRSLLTFLIVASGPTGVELAGAIAELARYGMDGDAHSGHSDETRRLSHTCSVCAALP
jgi:NADH dehydrogenase FAD-containing subunit